MHNKKILSLFDERSGNKTIPVQNFSTTLSGILYPSRDTIMKKDTDLQKGVHITANKPIN